MARHQLLPKQENLPLEGKKSKRANLPEHFRSRESEELIIGLVGPIGAGVSLTGEELKAQLQTTYGYTVHLHKVSELIIELGGSSKTEIDALPIADRFDRLQTLGNDLRRGNSESYLVEACIKRIGVNRKYDTIDGVRIPVSQRVAHIIDCMKHPSELELLQEVYREHFWAVAVLASETQRESRLDLRGFSTKADIDRVIARDANEAVGYGQKVSDVAHRADYFLHNNSPTRVGLKAKVSRLLHRIFNTDVASNSTDETGMASAFAAAMRSACLSRQVGAALISASGELIGVGWNDVPKFGGGLYGDTKPCASGEDHRCVRADAAVCHNDRKKRELYNGIVATLFERGLAKKNTEKKLLKALEESNIKNIIEYSRSIHAEMEAILSAGRQGRSAVGATLYTTVYPCHGCARHIVAAGVKDVVFIEPYRKSLAIELHSDAISEDAEAKDKLVFRQYEGISPRSMTRIYPLSEERKNKSGMWINIDPKSAKPVFRPALDSFIDREQLVIEQLTNSGEGNEQESKAQ